MGKTKTIQRDRHIYADDVKIKTTNVDGIYAKLSTFGDIGEKYHIEIKWDKIISMERGNKTPREFEKEYRGIPRI